MRTPSFYDARATPGRSETLVPRNLRIQFRNFLVWFPAERASGAIAKQTRSSARPSNNPVCQLSAQKSEHVGAQAKSRYHGDDDKSTSSAITWASRRDATSSALVTPSTAGPQAERCTQSLHQPYGDRFGGQRQPRLPQQCVSLPLRQRTTTPIMDFHDLPASQSACTFQEGTLDRLGAIPRWAMGQGNGTRMSLLVFQRATRTSKRVCNRPIQP